MTVVIPETGKMQLKDICYARSGDKGDKSNIGLQAIDFDEKVYELIKKKVTPEAVQAHFKEWSKGNVHVYPMDNVKALNIVLDHGLDGGMTTTLRWDGTGKAMCQALLRMYIDVDC
jgi:hypothetical protein